MSAQPMTAMCDTAACKQTAVTESGGWAFCLKHAEDDQKLQRGEDPEPDQDVLDADDFAAHGTAARARQHHRDGEKSCPPCAAAAARAATDRQGRAVSTAPSPIGVLLEQASAHSASKIRRLGARIEALLDELRTAITEQSEAEKARRAEAAALKAARAEIDELERQLAAAKAKLRGGTKVRSDGAVRPPKTAAQLAALQSIHAAGPRVCRDCATPIVRAPGQLGSLPFRCASCKATR